MRSVQTVVTGLAFAEGPRWHEEALYFSDMHGGRVFKIAGGQPEAIAALDDMTSGLGWLADGRLLVVSMEKKKLMRREADGSMAEHADLGAVATYHANDMIVRSDGTAYVGNFGFSLFPLGQPQTATLARVAPDGKVSAAATDLWFPNGIALTGDERTLIVAESGAYQITAFDVAEDGTLGNRRVWAQLGEGMAPDGLCIDAEGAVWVAIPHRKTFLRVRQGGEILEAIEVQDHALACALGGPDRRTLFMTTSKELEPEKCLANPSASVLAAVVDVRGEGRP